MSGYVISADELELSPPDLVQAIHEAQCRAWLNWLNEDPDAPVFDGSGYWLH